MGYVLVKLGGSLKAAAGGQTEFHVEAANIRQLLDQLNAEVPALRPTLKRGVTVAIDGVIYRDDWYQAISEDSEVFLLPKMAGG